MWHKYWRCGDPVLYYCASLPTLVRKMDSMLSTQGGGGGGVGYRFWCLLVQWPHYLLGEYTTAVLSVNVRSTMGTFRAVCCADAVVVLQRSRTVKWRKLGDNVTVGRSRQGQSSKAQLSPSRPHMVNGHLMQMTRSQFVITSSWTGHIPEWFVMEWADIMLHSFTAVCALITDSA